MAISGMRKALVTGGAGFIGCHLTEHLLRDGHAVTVIENFSTGRSENLATVKDHKGLELIELDIVNDQLEKIFHDHDWIFHLAALADIVPSIQNLQNTSKLMSLALRMYWKPPGWQA